MSFFEVSEGSIDTSGEFDMGGGSVIPDNTNCKACIEDIQWQTWEGDEFINAMWTVLDGDYKGRKVFQKIRAKDENIKKRDKAIRMLAAIDANSGGKLRESGKEPTDEMLLKALSNKPMIIKVMVWELDGKQGNWISMVSPLSSAATEPTASGDSAEDDIPW